jgi:hypothetical protein
VNDFKSKQKLHKGSRRGEMSVDTKVGNRTANIYNRIGSLFDVPLVSSLPVMMHRVRSCQRKSVCHTYQPAITKGISETDRLWINMDLESILKAEAM